MVSRLAITLLVISLPAIAFADGAFDLLRIDPSPRGAAIGSFPVALAYDDLGALLENPAGLSFLEGRNAQIVYADHPIDLSAGYISYGQPFAGGYGAAGITYFNYGEFDRYESITGEADGTFTPTDFMVTAGYARPLPYLDGLSVGGNVKFLHSTIDEYTSTAAAFDLGALWCTGMDGVDVGLTVSNVGAQLSTYDGVDETLPLTVRVGVTNQLEHLPLKLSVTGHYEKNEDIFGTAAGEFTVSPILKLRAGYTTSASDFRVEGNEDSLAGISAGLGISLQRFTIDYAFHSQGAAGQIHRIGLSATVQ